MYYVYSTATCDTSYVIYVKNSSKDISIIAKDSNNKPLKVVIKGGHGVANKNLVTPKGVVTSVTDEQMDLLLQDANFKRHCERGFMTYDKKNVDTEKKAKDMADKDKSAPLKPDDFIETENSSDEAKVYKDKSSKRK